MMHLSAAASLVAALVLESGTAFAGQPIGPVPMVAEINARTITSMLYQSKPGERPDLSGKFLVYLDLTGLNFKGAIIVSRGVYWYFASTTIAAFPLVIMFHAGMFFASGQFVTGMPL
jgi:hypothetical protein